MKNKYILAAIFLIFASALLIPITAISPQYFDGGELVTAAFSGANVHQPGYPVYMLITKYLLKIFDGNPYKVISSFSMACHIFACLLLFFSTHYLTKSNLLSLSIGLSALFFSESLKIAADAEVFGLHFLIISSIFFMTIKFYYENFNGNFLISIGLLSGLGCAHHHSIILLAPFVIIAVLSKPSINARKAFLILFLCGALGFMANLLLFSGKNILGYKEINSFSDLFICIFRKDYGTLSLYKDALNINYSYLFDFIYLYLKEIPVFLLLTGILTYLAIKNRHSLYVAMLLSLIFHLWFFEQFKFPVRNLVNQEVTLRFAGILALLLAFASILVLKEQRLHKYYKPLSFILFIFVFAHIKDNYYEAKASNDLVVLSELNSISKEIQSGSVLFTGSDRVGMGMHYQQIINNMSKDIKLVHLSALGNVDYNHFLLKKNPELKSVDVLSYENIANFYLKRGVNLYTSLDNRAPDGYYLLPIGVTWILIPNGQEIDQQDILKNIINHCFRLPRGIFDVNSERKYSNFLVDNVYLKPFQVFIEEFPQHRATTKLSELLVSIKNSEYDKSKQVCSELVQLLN